MIEIGMNGVTKNYGFNNVLTGVDMEIITGDRVGIVGRNGTGKTTLFKLITGEETPTQGAVSVRRGATIGYLEQIPVLPTSDTCARELLMQPFEEIMTVERRLRALESSMAQESDAALLERHLNEYSRVQAHFATIGGYDMEEAFSRVVGGFGISELLDRPFRVLSGGQKTIVKLAATLLRQPDILLLDEPTNHLDIRTMEWFEGFVAKYRGTVVIISHDRYFLDKAVTKTIMLERGACKQYTGNYTKSLQERERQLLIEFEQYKTQQKKIDAMKAAIHRYRVWAAQSDNEDFYRKAKELEKRLEKMEVLDKPQMEAARIPLKFAGARTGREVLAARDFTLAYGETRLFSKAAFTVYEREKVCFMGDNGTGKTSLLRAVLGEECSHQGQIVVNPSAKIGFIPQEIRFPDPTCTVLEAFRAEHVCTEGVGRNILAKYFFYGDSVFKRVSALSGGEKVLLKLAALVQNEINFLVLDEPTNHIDIEFREMLEESLKEFGGTLLFVSHDRFFINKLAMRILTIDRMKITSFYGNYDELVRGRTAR